MKKRFTLLWQSKTPHEREWIEEIFGPYVKEYVTDSKHEVVLDDCILCDAFIQGFDPAYYARFRGKNAFLVHFLDENYEGNYELYQNFKGVYRNFGSSVFNPTFVKTLPLGTNAGVWSVPSAQKPALQRRYIWSFAGYANKTTRPDMMRALLPVEPHFTFILDSVPGFVAIAPVTKQRLPLTEYKQVLEESMFAPSPMGNVNIDCYRVYEALECGAIPIVERRLTIDYFRQMFGAHPLPTVARWSEARAMIAHLVKDPPAIERLQQECVTWWAEYKSNFSNEVGVFLQTRTGDNTTADRPMYESRANSRLWQVTELVRHHNGSALKRRLHYQVVRLVKHRKFRVAYRRGHGPDNYT